ncbi:MAG: PhzF family phenazine biosynthesis protein [Candidatus Nanopelagicales bacterium]
MTRSRGFTQVDVFAGEGLSGNPLAVVHDSDGLSTEEMLAFTRWTNLSEVTFLAPPTLPDADYAVRIFYAGGELPFAGHPTLGSAHAWLGAGGLPRREGVVVQECGAGAVPVRIEGGLLSFRAPELLRSGPLGDDELEETLRFLRIEREQVLDHAWCDNGPGWRGVLLRSAEDVLALDPDASLIDGLDVGVVGAHAPGSPTDFEVRTFFPGASGMAEDPVTGSFNAAVGQWLTGTGRAPERYLATQGTALGRQGRVEVVRDDEGVWVGGACTTVVSGSAVL